MQKSLGIYVAGRVLEVGHMTSKSGKNYFRIVLYVGASQTVTVLADAAQPQPCAVDDMVVFAVRASGNALFFLDSSAEGGDD